MSAPVTVGSCTLHHGDMLRVLPTLEAESFHAAVTDPPYHLTSIVERFGADNAAPAKVGKTGAYARASAGFMGQRWDGGDIAFRPETWAEVIRVLKPGAFMACFASTRGYHRMVCAVEDAGFIIHPMLGWLFGVGFPKAHRVEAEGWEGWRYGLQALKPALEPICLAQKPMRERTGTAQVLATGTGALNVGACRVNPGEPVPGGGNGKANNGGRFGGAGGTNGERPRVKPHTAGRWPPNLVTDGSDEVKGGFAAFGERPSRNGETVTARTTRAGTMGYHGRDKGCTSAVYGNDTGTAARFFPALGFGEDEQIQRALSPLLWQWEIDILGVCTHAPSVAASSLSVVRAESAVSALPSAQAFTPHESADKSPLLSGTVSPAVSASNHSHQPASSTAQCDVVARPEGPSAHAANGAASPSASCATPTVPDPARARIRSANDLKERFTSATGNDCSLIVETLITTIQSIESASSPERQPRKLTLSLDHVRSAATREPSGITTITISLSKSDGSATDATFVFTPKNSAHGAKDCLRFSYSAKANKKDRAGSRHPTIKPQSLLRWLCRLITPPSGTILDPFAGSGSLGQAALAEGFSAILIEREAEYFADMRRRLGRLSGADTPLFADQDTAA